MNSDSASRNSSSGGLMISNTDSIRSFISDSDLSKQSSIPYKSLRSFWDSSDPSTRPNLTSLLSGSSFIFNSPKPREKSEELKARLRKLTEVAERKAYEELVSDITPRKPVDEPFSSYKHQLGFGLHVVVTMFTGYLVGYATFRALFGHSPVMNVAGGIFGLVCAMLVETLLFIIRSSEQDRRSTLSTSELKKNQ